MDKGGAISHNFPDFIYGLSLSMKLPRLEAEGGGLQGGRVPDGALGVAHSTQVT